MITLDKEVYKRLNLPIFLRECYLYKLENTYYLTFSHEHAVDLVRQNIKIQRIKLFKNGNLHVPFSSFVYYDSKTLTLKLQDKIEEEAIK